MVQIQHVLHLLAQCRSVIDKTTVSNGLLGEQINYDEKLIIELVSTRIFYVDNPKKLLVRDYG